MFDFRYHALSLVAVFLALAIGILLGATIGDSLVSEAGKGLSSSLHKDLVNARQDARGAHSQLSQRDKIIAAELPAVVQNVLAGQRGWPRWGCRRSGSRGRAPSRRRCPGTAVRRCRAWTAWTCRAVASRWSSPSTARRGATESRAPRTLRCPSCRSARAAPPARL